MGWIDGYGYYSVEDIEPWLITLASTPTPLKEEGTRMIKRIVSITQKHIDGGCKGDADNCPGALAINEAVADLGLHSVVSAYNIGFADADDLQVGGIDAPHMLRAFVRQFDAGEPVSPFSFEIKIPEDFISYKLSLTGPQARTLAALLYRVGGVPSSSPRRHANAIRDKLHAHGFYGGKGEEDGLVQGHMEFRNYPESEPQNDEKIGW